MQDKLVLAEQIGPGFRPVRRRRPPHPVAPSIESGPEALPFAPNILLRPVSMGLFLAVV